MADRNIASAVGGLRNSGSNKSAKANVMYVHKNRRISYPIYLEDSFLDLAQKLDFLEPSGRRIAVITDSNVEKLYLNEVMRSLTGICAQVSSITIGAGEEHKNLDEIRRIYADLIEHSLDRHDILVALGGGVIGDMTGFAAATYLRGIRFVQIPTTLLSMVDSSIGGKTGVDFDSYKNMVGAFHQPSLVYVDISTLMTLDARQFSSGMGEVIKHGIILDAPYYEWCLDHMQQIMDRDIPVLREMVFRSINIKRKVVEKDPYERGERALLNFGHTAGHAIEKLKNFSITHGGCVSMGIIVASYISWKRGYIDDDIFFEIRDMMVGYGLPISFDSLDIDDIIAAMKKDKKMNRGRIRYILLKELGNAYIDETVTEDEIHAALEFIRYEEP